MPLNSEQCVKCKEKESNRCDHKNFMFLHQLKKKEKNLI